MNLLSKEGILSWVEEGQDYKKLEKIVKDMNDRDLEAMDNELWTLLSPVYRDFIEGWIEKKLKE